METFSALLALCAGNSPVTGEFPSQRPVTRSFDVFFDLRLKKNAWVNNREAGDLRRHHAHYDVIVMDTRDESRLHISRRNNFVTCLRFKTYSPFPPCIIIVALCMHDARRISCLINNNIYTAICIA